MKNATDIIMNLRSEGLSLSEIARELEGAGVVNANGNKYNNKTISQTINRNWKKGIDGNAIENFILARREDTHQPPNKHDKNALIIKTIISANYLDLEQKVQLIEDIYSM